MSWKNPILTDSGGFQVFSLAKLNRIDDEGVSFQSPRDGKQIFLTPEKAIEIQKQKNELEQKAREEEQEQVLNQ